MYVYIYYMCIYVYLYIICIYVHIRMFNVQFSILCSCTAFMQELGDLGDRWNTDLVTEEQELGGKEFGGPVDFPIVAMGYVCIYTYIYIYIYIYTYIYMYIYIYIS